MSYKAIIIKGIPLDLKKKFHKLCIDADISLKEGFIRLMKFAVNQNKIPGKEGEE